MSAQISHGDLLLLAGTVGEALFIRFVFTPARFALGLPRNLRLLALKNHALENGAPETLARYQTDTTSCLLPCMFSSQVYKLHTSTPNTISNTTQTAITNVHIDTTDI